MTTDLRFTVSRRSLLALATHCRQAADPKAAMPMLANVKLTLRGSTLEGVATDLYRQASMKIDVQVDHPSTLPRGICVPAIDFLERVNAMPDGLIRITTAEKGTKFTLASTVVTRKYTIHALSDQEFPSGFELGEDSTPVIMPAGDLAMVLRSVIEAASDDTTRNVNNVFFETNAGSVKMVTTDGYRLQLRSVALADKRPKRDMLLPLEAARNLIRVLDDAIGEVKGAKGKGDEKTEKTEEKAVPISVTITESGPHAHVIIGNRSFGFKKVDQSFPPYAQVIPGRTDNAMTLSKSVFLAAAKAIDIAANKKVGGIKLVITKNRVEVMSSSAETGEGSELIDVDYDGPAVTIGLQASYIADALAPIASDEIKMGFGSDLDPIKFSALEHDDISKTPAYVAVVMPMRV